jgi:hypothetical protein
MARAVWVDSKGNRYHRHFSESVAINKASGTKILVTENEDPGSYAEGFKWATMCLDHARICHWETLAQARMHAAQPDWCGPCQHIMYHDTDECLHEYATECAYDHTDLSQTRTDINDDIGIGMRYRYELIEGEVLV